MPNPTVITARWRDIAILSWPVEDDVLAPFLPTGLDLDHWRGDAYISLVCLFMENVRAWGLPALPRRFAEVNLRFYVRFAHHVEERQGVVFLRQLVSSPFVSFAGRLVFREPMLSTAVSRQIEPVDPSDHHGQRRLHYRWLSGGRNEGMRLIAAGDPCLAEAGSLDEFLTARHWGFNAQSEGRVRTYRIRRDPWSLVPVVEHELKCDVGALCGTHIADSVAVPPASALLATGSDTRIHWPTKLR